MEQMSRILKIEELSVYYGQICAIKRINMEVFEGEIVTLIGSNGAGKSTLINTIIGLQKATKGKITFMNEDITKVSTDKVIKRGISVVPEGRGMLASMTVLENLQLGAYHKKNVIEQNLEKVYERFPILYDRRLQKAGTLSGGEQQMLAISRAIMGDPKLILLDEPSLALSPAYVDKIFKILVELKKEGMTILLSEQNAKKALQYSDRGYVLDLGETVLDGKSSDLAGNPAVRSAYLGAD
ncbi:branched-chain amino acid transport system ATP-binding protein [Parasporobacterium paucivorans DSM 15970]|uniref:Branched-chain amino acid transport system ATP-binding protein n=1 Tax=Parasporobacterium paucivorans DSM 15970 TaxID=1122934 RepID=A0A1M6GXL3_9FIRM|nr:branched-chain amino acid transport system ATP-binding protein [Parasporobacterium paucivorans DSM 15970]